MRAGDLIYSALNDDEEGFFPRFVSSSSSGFPSNTAPSAVMNTGNVPVTGPSVDVENSNNVISEVGEASTDVNEPSATEQPVTGHDSPVDNINQEEESAEAFHDTNDGFVEGDAISAEGIDLVVDLSNLGGSIQVESIPTSRIHKNHPKENIIGDPSLGIRTRQHTMNECLYACFISQVEPKSVDMALRDNSWVQSMQEELQQFDKLNVWTLVDLPADTYPFGTKWIFKNKTDDRGVVSERRLFWWFRDLTNKKGLITRKCMLQWLD